MSLPALVTENKVENKVEAQELELGAVEVFHSDVTIELGKKAKIARRGCTFRIVQATQAIQALTSLLLSSVIGLLLVLTQPPVPEQAQAQARDVCLYLLISAISCDGMALGLQVVFLRRCLRTSKPSLTHNLDQPPPPATTLLRIVFLRTHAIIGTFHPQPQSILPPKQASPSTCTVPILQISVLRRIRPLIRCRVIAFGSLAAQVLGIVLMTAALVYSESRHVSHAASVVGLYGMGVMALLQILCLLLAYMLSKRKY